MQIYPDLWFVDVWRLVFLSLFEKYPEVGRGAIVVRSFLEILLGLAGWSLAFFLIPELYRRLFLSYDEVEILLSVFGFVIASFGFGYFTHEIFVRKFRKLPFTGAFDKFNIMLILECFTSGMLLGFLSYAFWAWIIPPLF